MESNQIHLDHSYFESNFSSDKYDALIAFLSNSDEKTTVLYNHCYGGFGLSEEAKILYKEYTDNKYDDFTVRRHCPYLVKVFEVLGSEKFGSSYSKIKSCEIPIYMEHYYSICEYDGLEGVELKIEWFKYDIIQFVVKSSMNDTQKVKIINIIIDKKSYDDSI
jgi:hypothetical protein